MAEGHPKANVILHADFNKYPAETMEKMKGASGCVWALGVSVVDVSKKDYEDITFSYPLAAAKSFASLSEPFKLVYVSGEGATLSPGFLTPFFGAVKGRTEAALLDLTTQPGYTALKPYSVRPAGVDPKFHEEIHEWIPKLRPAAKAILGPVALGVMRNVSPSMISPTRDLGKVLVELAMSDGQPLTGGGVSGDGRTISNVGFRRLAGI
ncbi:hypothetical protein MMC20_002694 [Loxospora ochrophaea]|nr:hypothetical protein [Loxospora ochrophaea]